MLRHRGFYFWEDTEMAKNDNLHKAKDAKNDEFYTRIEDVAEELRHYKKHFAGKVVFCNCDDPTWSAFWRYFHLNFAELGLIPHTMTVQSPPTRWSTRVGMTTM